MKDWLPELPTLGSEVEIPVYVIHRSADPEDYFFIFDFELFLDRSKAGLFVRPKLTVWAGRHDIDRRLFARAFRESFSREFDRMRAEVGRKDNGGWLTWDFGLGVAGDLVAGIAAYMVILVATGAGRALTSLVPVPGWLKGKSAEAKAEDQIDAVKGRVEAALERIDIVLLHELYAQAYRGQAPGPFPGMDADAWPLPAFVREHLTDGRSLSWW